MPFMKPRDAFGILLVLALLAAIAAIMVLSYFG